MPVCGTSSVNLTAHLVPDDLPERWPCIERHGQALPWCTPVILAARSQNVKPTSWGVAADVFPATLSQLIGTICTSNLAPVLFFIA